MDEATDDEKSVALKEQGNQLFRADDFEGACRLWTKAIDDYAETAETSTILALKCNRAAGLLKLCHWDQAMNDCLAVLESEHVDDMLALKAHRRFNQAFPYLGYCGLKGFSVVMKMHKIRASKYQEAHPENKTIFFGPEEAQILRRFEAALGSRAEYEKSHPPSEDDVTFSYEVILHGRYHHLNGDSGGIEDYHFHSYDSGPRLSPVRDAAEHAEQHKMINERMIKPTEKRIIEYQRATFGDDWGCVVCGEPPTILHHYVLAALDHGDPIVEDYASSLCKHDGDCWRKAVLGKEDPSKVSLRLRRFGKSWGSFLSPEGQIEYVGVIP